MDADERAFLWLENECQECPKCMEFISHLRSRLTAPPLLANDDAQPRPTVTRANIVAILAEAGSNIGITTDRVELAIAQFRDLGITVEEEK